MDMYCGNCEKTCREVEICCGGYCGKIFHFKCVGLSKYEKDALFKYPNIKYLCDGCLNFIKITNENYKNLLILIKENESKMAEVINKTNKLVEQQVKDAKTEIVNELKKQPTTTAGEETYANKLKSSNNMPVILKPKNKQDSDVTEKEIKEKIKLSNLNMKVKRIVKRSEGVVAISCQNESDRSILTNEIQQKMGNDYEVRAPKMRNPKLLIVGMSEELDKDTIVKALRKQNNIECEYIECVKVYKSYKNPKIFNAIIETNGEGFSQIINSQKVNIEWDRCAVYQSCSVLRCFKCWGFNHTSRYCKNEEQICAKCSESGHSYKDCQKNIFKCINCEKAKERLNLMDINTSHDCRNAECPILIKKTRIESEKISY